MRPHFGCMRLGRVTLLLFQLGLVWALPIDLAGTSLKLSNLPAQAQTLQDRKTEADRLNENGRQQLDRGQLREALQTFEQALVIHQEIGNKAGVGETLNNIGEVYNNLGRYYKALETLQQSLAIRREVGDRKGVGETLYNIGESYNALSQFNKALEVLRHSLAIRREVGDRQGEGRTLQNMGVVYNRLGQYSQALESYQQALDIARTVGDRLGEGRNLNGIGVVYNNLGQYSQALEFFQHALKIRQEIGAKVGEGATLNNIGLVYASLGQYPKAIESFEQALKIARTIGDRPSEGNSLNSLGGVYDYLGQYPKALELYQQALAIRREIGDKAGVGRTLNNIGLVYSRLKQYAKALEFYQQSLVIRREISDRLGEGRTLQNIGAVYDNQNQYSQALEFYQQALAIRQQIGDRPGEGATLNNIGLAYNNLGQYPQALESYQQALGIFKEIGDKAGERIALSNIGALLAQQNQPELAIVFYKQSVNITEAIRKDIRVLSPEQQESYTKTIADTYRTLADLLLRQNRILEAQQVLDLLKLQELDDYLRNVRGNQQTTDGIELLPAEQQVLNNYAEIQNKAIQIGKELTQLRQIPPESRTPAQQQRIAQLEQMQQQIRAAFNKFIRSPEVAARVQQLNQTTGGQNLDLPNLNRLTRQLQEVESKAAVLYPLILEDRLELVLVTPNSPPIHRSVPVRREDLNRAILNFRATLTDPTESVKNIVESARELYNWLIKPIENDLTQAQANTIIYAPDGQLRYIPLAALHDGKQWLVQRFNINNITAASLIDFNPQSLDEFHVFAGAFTTGRYKFQVGMYQFDFAGLPFAGKEVTEIATLIPNTTKLLDSAFNRDATVPHLNDYNIVHLATHGVFVRGQPEESFILFGDGDRVTLRDIETWNLTADLVVLSACQTGIGGQLGNGEEILGLGYQMQQAGAKATIASLWTVSDEGTQRLMSAFYQTLQSRKTSTAEALRQAQLTLINDNYNQGRPYYWAPFILIGNGF